MIAYWFVFRWAIRLLWHYKVYAGVFDKGKTLDKEEKLYTKLSLQTKVLFLKLGGVYIKAGQFLSNLAHIFPPQFIENLKDLQDRVPA
ncbi:MAG TPA: AarF/ABC1/UbiB kinase family protein, partial [Leptospiraceae bacterium]|nr:AarF/ABC1/UbiB kinase family protein [Leptospiraceae bacterium]